MAKTFGAAAKTAPAKAPPAKTEAPAAKEWTPQAHEVGTFKNIISKKTGDTYQAMEILQDITLPKGTLVFFTSLDDELANLVKGGHIDEDTANQRKEKLGEWLIGKFNIAKVKN